jgi:hypothetical protein
LGLLPLGLLPLGLLPSGFEFGSGFSPEFSGLKKGVDVENIILLL